MHIQKSNKILKRVSCFVFSLVICFSLVFPCFADMTSGLPVKVSSSGLVGVSFDNVLYSYYLPENHPSQVNATNYICLLCPAGLTTVSDEKVLYLVWLEFSSTDWSFTPSELLQTDRNGNICYKGIFGGSSSVSLYYTSLHPNTSNNQDWSVYDRDLTGLYPFLTIIASSKQIESNGFIWIGETTYRQGSNGSIQGSLSGTVVTPGGQTIFVPIQPDYTSPVITVVESDGYDLFYAFINGMWSGLWQGYTIFSNGIAIGDFTLHQLIVSILCVLFLLVFFFILAKVVIK